MELLETIIARLLAEIDVETAYESVPPVVIMVTREWLRHRHDVRLLGAVGGHASGHPRHLARNWRRILFRLIVAPPVGVFLSAATLAALVQFQLVPPEQLTHLAVFLLTALCIVVVWEGMAHHADT